MPASTSSSNLPSSSSSECFTGPAPAMKLPQDVGICAVEFYFPSLYVDQSELEMYDGVSSGKYTIGLGQSCMSFCSDREDINSMCLTVFQRLMEANGISYSQVGRLEVGTETLLDKSKSVKTVLMSLFEESGNSSVEGVDTTNACYGGTAALINAVNWIESSSWDGRYAVVVAGDIAVYASGNARSTGGAAAIAMLIGPNAPLILDQRVRATHMQHVYDFYKPDMSSEYPTVDGKLSIQCYQHALDKCYQEYTRKVQQQHLIENFTVASANAFVFHSPYCKLVQKSLARLVLNDFLRDPNPDFNGLYNGLEEFRKIELESTYFNKQVESTFVKCSEKAFLQKTKPSLFLANRIGNMYTPSVYSCLLSYIMHQSLADLPGQRIVLFSYGSGLASSMFSLHITQDNSSGSSLEKLYHSISGIRTRLESRVKFSPKEFEETLQLREKTHHIAPYVPIGSTDHLYPGTWYLTEVDDKHRRKYAQKPASPLCDGHANMEQHMAQGSQKTATA
ncbi:hydroxymethylglutaryl-CoA synthase 1 [Octopus sinensis]|uniref:Hydroxymethylglutaryl-CoA synthase n=1 Tax=Octopus sinensis TaxID=2607531 RepID=A0A6P7TUB8_9MOLL|nr:hydroxymethylglutaryl-CoA synthase 1 [Octopus sinensis]